MLSDNELTALIGRKLHRAINSESGDISSVRVENMNRYLGAPYGNERDGHSKVVTREVLETVEWAVPSVLRVFLSGDQVVSFEPVGPEDDEEAEQQTDIANHYLLKENNGFVALHHWCKDCFINPNGYIGLWLEEKTCSRVEKYEGISAIGLTQAIQTLAEKGDVEVLEHSEKTVDTEQGPIETFDVRVRVTWKDKRPRLEAIPSEELLVDSDAVSLDLDEAEMVARRQKKPFSALIREGFDRDKLEEVGSGQDYDWLDEKVARMFYEDEDPEDEDDDPSMRDFWVHDCYLWIDADEDGVAEFRHIVMVGAEIFVNEEVSYQPFVAMAAILLPHKHTGLSFVDIVKDLQEIKTTLWRQLLDNVYKRNVPRKYVGDAFISDQANTLDVLLDNTSEFIPARDPNAIREEVVQPVVAELMPVIQGINDMQKVRTGVAPELSLDPNVLQQSTASAFGQALDRASERVEMVVRIFAETGFRKLFIKLHQLLREHVDIPKHLRIRGKWVEFNPATWAERTNVNVNTGLGFNRKEQKIGLLAQLLEVQKEGLQIGLVTPEKLYHTLDKLVDAAGVGHVSQFFVDPKSPEYKPPQPQQDPMIELAKQDLQAKQQKQAMDHQHEMAKLQLEMKDQGRQNMDLMMKVRELEKKIGLMTAQQALTEAQTIKTMREAAATAVNTVQQVAGVDQLLAESR